MAIGRQRPGWIQKCVSAEDVVKVNEAIRTAEAKTRGEIVPVIVRSSTPRRGVITTAILFCVALFGFLETHFFAAYEPYSFLIAMALAVMIGFGLSQIASVQRLLLLEPDEQKAVFERAELEFYRQKVHETYESTGILIFLSLLEHKVVVLADKGIAEKLSADTWKNVVERLIHAIKDEKIGEGLIQAIQECGDLLASKFPRHAQDLNELPNDLIFKE